MADLKNVKTAIDGNKLVIQIDLGVDFGVSKSGKSVIVASTGGFTAIAGGFALNLNVIKK